MGKIFSYNAIDHRRLNNNYKVKSNKPINNYINKNNKLRKLKPITLWDYIKMHL
jgi:hypothetical protein